jgi:hypothetical protein
MTLSSRLPDALTLDQRAGEINRLLDKISTHGAQTERLRWRVAIELHNCQKMVRATGERWEKWCEDHIRRSLRDIRKLLKMAEAQDAEAAHETEKAATKERMMRNRQKQKDSNADQRAHTPAFADPEQPSNTILPFAKPPGRRAPQNVKRILAIQKLISAILRSMSVREAQELLLQVDMDDLHEALEAAASGANP